MNLTVTHFDFFVRKFLMTLFSSVLYIPGDVVVTIIAIVVSACILLGASVIAVRFCRRKRAVRKSGSYEKIRAEHRLQHVAVEKNSTIPATAR